MEIPELKGCRACQKVFKPEEFMSPKRDRIFKMCHACRDHYRVRCRERNIARKAKQQEKFETVMAEVEYLRAMQRTGATEPTATLGETESIRSIWSGRGAHESTNTSGQNGDANAASDGDEQTTETLRKEDSTQESDGPISDQRKYSDPGGRGDSSSGSSKTNGSPGETPTSVFFMCLHCGKPRSSHLGYDSICAYCMEQYKFCILGWHEEVISMFVGKNGTEYAICKSCREDAGEEEPVEQSVAEKAPAIEETVLIKQEPEDEQGCGLREIRPVRTSGCRAEKGRAFTGWRGRPEIIVIDD